MLGWLVACTTPQAEDTADTAADTADTADPSATDTGDPGPLVGRLGRTWRFDLTTSRITEPADAGELLRSYLGSHLLVQVVAEETAGMTLRLAWSDGDADVQSAVASAVDTPAAPNEGLFTTEPADFVLFALDDMPAEQLVLSGTMSEDYLRVDDASLVLLGDTVALQEILSEEEPTAFCDLLTGLGGACQPCASGAETCAWFRFEGLTGVDVSPLDLEVH